MTEQKVESPSHNLFHARELKRIFDLLGRAPISILSIIGVSCTISFNIGYFIAVGLIYISVFPLQESIIFSISGAIISTILATIVQAFFNIFNISKFIKRKETSARIAAFFAFALIISCLISLYIQSKRFYENGNIILVTYFLLACSAALISAASLKWSSIDDRIPPILAVPMLLVTVMLSVAFYGHYTISYSPYVSSHRVILGGYRSASIVRLGSQFSLVKFNDDAIHLIRTDQFKDISSTSE